MTVHKLIDASANLLIESWMDINEAIVKADSVLLRRRMDAHLNLFHERERAVTAKRIEDIVTRMSKSDALENMARASAFLMKPRQQAA